VNTHEVAFQLWFEVVAFKRRVLIHKNRYLSISNNRLRAAVQKEIIKKSIKYIKIILKKTRIYFF
jgi:hypothetical protein